MISGLTHINMLCGVTPLKASKSVLKFCSENINKTDTFERSCFEKFDLKLRGQTTDILFNSSVELDLSKPQRFRLYTQDKGFDGKYLNVDYDPKRTGVLYDKRTFEDVPVTILKASEDDYPMQATYHFMSKDLSHEYGHVELDRNFYSEHDEELLRNYPKQGIVGDRVFVDWLMNKDKDFIGGVGKLADKMAVSYCVENNIPLNIVSFPGANSHLAHFRRGKRFVPPKRTSFDYIFLKKRYGSGDPNVVLEKLSELSDRLDEHIDLHDFGTYVMYLPKELAEKYKRELYPVEK